MTGTPTMPPGDEEEYLFWNWRDGRRELEVIQSTREVKVSYPSSTGGKPFRVIFRQKPNPIGFHARLPGDKI